jgi:predicted kinase
VVSQDDLIDAITPSGFDHSARPIYAAAEEVIARTALRAGRIVIVDRTNRTRALRKRWIAIAQEMQCAVVAITMSADVETCRSRNRARSGLRCVCEERMERMISVFEAPQLEEGFDAIVDDRRCPTVLAVIEAASRSTGLDASSDEFSAVPIP